MAQARLESTLWPDTLRLFPDIAERLRDVDPVAMLQRTLQAGVFDEYGLPAFEEVVEQHSIKIQERSYARYESSLDLSRDLSCPTRCMRMSSAATVRVKKHELRLPKKCEISATLLAIGDDLAVIYRDEKYQGHFFWVSNPRKSTKPPPTATTTRPNGWPRCWRMAVSSWASKPSGPATRQMPQAQPYVHDGTRFWRLSSRVRSGLSRVSLEDRRGGPANGKAGPRECPALV